MYRIDYFSPIGGVENVITDVIYIYDIRGTIPVNVAVHLVDIETGADMTTTLPYVVNSNLDIYGRFINGNSCLLYVINDIDFLILSNLEFKGYVKKVPSGCQTFGNSMRGVKLNKGSKEFIKLIGENNEKEYFWALDNSIVSTSSTWILSTNINWGSDSTVMSHIRNALLEKYSIHVMMIKGSNIYIRFLDSDSYFDSCIPSTVFMKLRMKDETLLAKLTMISRGGY